MRCPSPSRRATTCLAVLAVSAAAFPVVSRWTHHPGETIILLMPPTLGTILWSCFPRVRKIPRWKYLLYIAVIVPVVYAAMAFAAHMARGRIVAVEVVWVVYFIIAWRMALAIWTRTVGRVGESYHRWGRLLRRRSAAQDGRRRHFAQAARLIVPARTCLTLLVFVPLLAGSFIHRFRIANPTELPELSLWQVQDVTIHTPDGIDLSAWFMPDPHSDTTVIIAHGLGANKANFLDFLRVFHRQGYNALIFDFRGHGDSQGHTSTFGLLERRDILAVVDWLKEHRPKQSRHVLGLGSSMGAAALLGAAANDPRIEALVLDSCFVSAPTFLHHHFRYVPLAGRGLADLMLLSASLHAGCWLRDLDPGRDIARLGLRPVLLIHGRDDTLIPPDNMDQLHRRANGPKDRWLGPGPHSNIVTSDFPAYRRRVIAFFDGVKRSR